MKTYCVVCGKETGQEEVKDEIAPGVYVRSTKCTVCSEALVLRIPKDIQRQMGFREGDYVDLYTAKDEVRIKVKVS